MNQLPDKKNDTLKKLISASMLEQPSDQFTASVMSKLGIAPAPSAIRYEPVISQKAWIFITVITGLLVYLAVSGSASSSFGTQTIVVQSMMDQTASMFDQLFSGSVALLMAISSLAVFLLFGAESIYRQSQLKTA